jgi:hypothetical protein
VPGTNDRAVSGASLIRSGIQALLADALRGRFDIVLAEALDRMLIEVLAARFSQPVGEGSRVGDGESEFQLTVPVVVDADDDNSNRKAQGSSARQS